MLRFGQSLLGALLACVLLASCDAAVGSGTVDARGGAARDHHQAKAAKSAKAEARRAHPRRQGAGADRRERGRLQPRPVRTYLVTRVVDGDTLELGTGETVRLVGIDTPEVGQCGYDRATAALGRLVTGRRVRLARSDEDRDRYGRLLRYVDVGGADAGLRQIRSGLAVARYDSRDGYGFHPREPRYVAADAATRTAACARPAAAPQPLVGGRSGCAPGYSPCVPPFPPDADCADVDGPVRVTGPDPHGLDADGDGVACE